MGVLPSAESRPSPLTGRAFSVACLAILAVAGVVPLLLDWSAGASLWILTLGLAAGGLLTMAQPAPWRAWFWAVFVLGLTVRVVAHIGIYAFARSADGPFLSPDAILYFGQSLRLAMNDLRVPIPAYVYFGSYDCAHYYLFAVARWLFGAELFGLQMLNIILSSLAGPLTYAIARRLDVPYAAAIGLVVALYPSLIALSINDLMRDASVIGLFILGAWAVIELWVGGGRTLRRALLMVVAVLALTYVRMSRFYVPAFFEAGLLGALVIAAAKGWRRGEPGITRAALATLVTTMLLVEGLPMWLGWPSSPMMVWQQITHSLETPAMRLSAVGMVDRLQAGGLVGPKHVGDLSASGNLSVRASDIVAQVSRAGSKGQEPVVLFQPAPPKAVRPAPGPPPTMAQRLTLMASNGIRKFLGPFPWVMPPSWDARTILVGDYLMFPGMVIWYLLLPIAVAGLVVVPWHAIRQGQFAYPLLALTGFVGILFAQFVVLNLSYRQREFMFPFLALGAAHVVSRRLASTWAAVAYAAYLAGIVLLAVVHLVLRARMH